MTIWVSRRAFGEQLIWTYSRVDDQFGSLVRPDFVLFPLGEPMAFWEEISTRRIESLRSQGETSSWRDLVGVMFSLPVSDMSVWRVSLRCDCLDSLHSVRLDCLDSSPWDRLDCLDSLCSDRLDCLDSPPWDRLDCLDSLHADRLDCLDSGCCDRWVLVLSVLFSHLNRRYITGYDSICNMSDSMSIVKAL